MRRFFLVEKHDISKVSAAAIGSETETIGWDDCQFLAVADQLFRSSDAYLNLRRIAGQRLKDNPSHYMSLYVSIYGKRKEKDIDVLQKENKRALKALQQPQQLKQPEGVPARVVAEENGVKEVKSNGVVGEAREEINKEGGRDSEMEPQRKQSHATPFVNPHLRNIQSSIFNLESSIEKMREQLTSFSSKNLSGGGGGVGSPNNKLAFLQKKKKEKKKEKEKEKEKGKEKIVEEEPNKEKEKEKEEETEEELQQPREEPVFERTYEAYCEAILDGSHPGDFLTLQALSDHFGVGINVISSIIEDGYVQILPTEITQKRELWLSNWQNIFFASLYPQRYGMPIYIFILLFCFAQLWKLIPPSILASESDQPTLYNFLGNSQKEIGRAHV